MSVFASGTSLYLGNEGVGTSLLIRYLIKNEIARGRSVGVLTDCTDYKGDYTVINVQSETREIGELFSEFLETFDVVVIDMKEELKHGIVGVGDKSVVSVLKTENTGESLEKDIETSGYRLDEFGESIYDHVLFLDRAVGEVSTEVIYSEDNDLMYRKEHFNYGKLKASS